MKDDVFWLIFMIFQWINWFQSLYFDGIYLEVERDFATHFSYIVYYKSSPLFYSCLVLIYSKDIQYVVSYSSPFPRGNFLNPPKRQDFQLKSMFWVYFTKNTSGNFPWLVFLYLCEIKKKWLSGYWFSISIHPCNYNGALSFSSGLGWHYK